MHFLRYLKFPPLFFLAVGCATPSPPGSQTPDFPWPDVKIETFSDPHLYAPSLGTSGPAWDQLKDEAFELYQESPEILQTEVARILADKPGLVLVSGDLTKDGEKASHEQMATLLRPLTDAKIAVLVIPGNHDVDNPKAYGYSGAVPVPVPSVTPGEFAAIYRDYGYGSALSRDPASLSYIAEPIPGLRILALDTCRYEEYAAAGRQVTGGRIRPDTWAWIDQVLDQAARDRVPVAAMMHHILVPSFEGQTRVFRDYVVADQDEVQKRLADRGIRVIFTGHFHTLTASETTVDGQPLLDIGDGTLSMFPLGYRKIEVLNQTLHLETDYLKELPSTAGSPGRFYDRARTLVLENTKKWVRTLLQKKAFFSSAEAAALADWFGPSYLALIQGNPSKPEGWTWPPQGLGPLGALGVAYLGDVPEAIWKPKAVDDLTLDFNLGTP